MGETAEILPSPLLSSQMAVRVARRADPHQQVGQVERVARSMTVVHQERLARLALSRAAVVPRVQMESGVRVVRRMAARAQTAPEAAAALEAVRRAARRLETMAATVVPTIPLPLRVAPDRQGLLRAWLAAAMQMELRVEAGVVAMDQASLQAAMAERARNGTLRTAPEAVQARVVVVALARRAVPVDSTVVEVALAASRVAVLPSAAQVHRASSSSPTHRSDSMQGKMDTQRSSE